MVGVIHLEDVPPKLLFHNLPNMLLDVGAFALDIQWKEEQCTLTELTAPSVVILLDAFSVSAALRSSFSSSSFLHPLNQGMSPALIEWYS